MLINSTTTNTLTFTPTGNVNKFRHYYLSASGNATFNQQVDAETATSVNSNGSSAVVATTSTAVAAAGSHTLSIARTGVGGALYSVGMRAWNSNVSAIECISMGWIGAIAANYNDTTNFYSPQSAVVAIIADMVALGTPPTVFLGIDINDWRVPTSITTYTAQMQALITAFVGAGADVILVTGNPSSTSDTAAAQQTPFITAQYSLAQSNGIPIIDVYNRLGTWVQANALGEMYDTLHPNALGYADEAQAIGQFVAAV